MRLTTSLTKSCLWLWQVVCFWAKDSQTTKAALLLFLCQTFPKTLIIPDPSWNLLLGGVMIPRNHSCWSALRWLCSWLQEGCLSGLETLIIIETVQRFQRYRMTAFSSGSALGQYLQLLLRWGVAMLFWTSWPSQACWYTTRWNRMPRQAVCPLAVDWRSICPSLVPLSFRHQRQE